MVDEMYLAKATQYHGGKYVGADQGGNLYKGIIVFMIVDLKSRYLTLYKLFLKLNSVVSG